MTSKPKRVSAAGAIAATIGADIAEVRDYRYQRFTSPALYSIGDYCFALWHKPPVHDVGGEWALHSDQFFTQGTEKKVWVCKTVN